MRDASPQAIKLQDYLPPAFLISTTDLTIDLHEDVTEVTSSIAVVRNTEANAPSTAHLVLNGGKLPLISILLDDVELPVDQYELTEEGLTIKDVPDSFVLQTVTRIKPQENTTLDGLYKSQTMFCTQCEAEGFRNITFYLDRPDVMSEFTTKIIADKSLYPVLLSNGNLIARGELPEGRHWQQWHDPFRKPCYLFAMVAGNLSVVEDSFVTASGRKVALQIFVEEKDLDKCDHAMLSLKHAMKWDEEVYGREYDLDIFMIVAVDDFNMGAMENKGLNIFNTACVLANPQVTTDAAFQQVEGVVAHEYFHNWSGNRVTCRDWFQLSLKEGFTVFRDEEFSADMGSATVKRIDDVTLVRTAQFAEDAGPMAHPVQPSSYIEISNFYTLTIYEKGAEVVRMIYNLLGKDLFRQGSDLYFSRHDGQAVTINEFTSAMESVSGRDLTQFKRWYTQAGTPVLDVNDNYDASARTYQLTITQSCPPTPECAEKLPYHIPVAMGLLGAESELNVALSDSADAPSTHHVLELTEATQTFTFNNVNEKPVPALLRDFSAPVRLRYQYSRDDLLRLVRLDSNGFVRWDAMQQLAESIIQEFVSLSPSSDRFVTDQKLINAYSDVLGDLSMDQAMAAQLLRLPTEASLSEKMACVAVDGLHAGRDTVRLALAQALESRWLALYNTLNVEQEYAANATQIGQRSLKNVALGYLSLLDDSKYVELCLQQYQAATNMTDRLSALSCLVNSEADGATQQAQICLDDFYRQFAHEALAIDQWLSIQATSQKSNTLTRVKELMTHSCFSMTNPNKVRALIGAFCNQNIVNFHATDGSGYEFLAEQIIALNTVNPQIASRLLTPLTRWKKYDETRQGLMLTQLRRIHSLPTLSKDVFEVVSKSLGDRVDV